MGTFCNSGPPSASPEWVGYLEEIVERAWEWKDGTELGREAGTGFSRRLHFGIEWMYSRFTYMYAQRV